MVKGKKYIDTPSKYYFTDLWLRNARLNFRQMEFTHLMENAIYNELRLRGLSVDVGQVPVMKSGEDGKRQHIWEREQVYAPRTTGFMPEMLAERRLGRPEPYIGVWPRCPGDRTGERACADHRHARWLLLGVWHCISDCKYENHWKTSLQQKSRYKFTIRE